MQDATSRLTALNRRLDNIQQVLVSHRDHEHGMTPGGRALLNQAETLLDHARLALEHRWSRTAPLSGPTKEQARRNICDDFAAVLRELAVTLLPALQGTLSNRVPVELEPVMQRLADLAAPSWNSQIILYAADALNYSIERHDDPVSTLSPTLAPSLPTPPAASGPFLFLRVPSVERDTATLHGIVLGHEIGHLRDWANGLSSSVPTSPPTVWCDSTGSLMIDRVPSYRRYTYVLTRWSAEIVADILAAQLTGPAALCAFGELIGNLAIWETDTLTHPAPDRRALITAELLASLGYDAIPEVKAILDHYQAESAGADVRPAKVADVPLDDADDLVWKLIHSKLPDLINKCGATIASGEALTAADWPEVLEQRKVLNGGRPTGEVLGAGPTSKALGDAVILNAAWMTRVEGMTGLGSVLGLDPTVSTEASQISAVLDELLLKSFEIAEVRRTQPWPK